MGKQLIANDLEGVFELLAFVCFEVGHCEYVSMGMWTVREENTRRIGC